MILYKRTMLLFIVLLLVVGCSKEVDKDNENSIIDETQILEPVVEEADNAVESESALEAEGEENISEIDEDIIKEGSSFLEESTELEEIASDTKGDDTEEEVKKENESESEVEKETDFQEQEDTHTESESITDDSANTNPANSGDADNSETSANTVEQEQELSDSDEESTTIQVNIGGDTSGSITVNIIGSQSDKEINEAYLPYCEINDSMSGWIKLPGTVIDYPVLQHSDNEFYLSHDINMASSSEGSIALDFRINPERLENQTILFGHNMKAGTMFTMLTRYKLEEFFYSNQIIEFNTLYKNMKWQLFSAYVTDASDTDVMMYPLRDEALYQAYIDKALERSLYDASVSVTTDDQILTLITCSYEWEGAKMVVHFKRIQ